MMTVKTRGREIINPNVWPMTQKASYVQNRSQKFMIFTLLCVAAALATPGCAKKQERIPINHVSGMLTVDGQPAPGVIVCFHPKSELGIRPLATVAADGTFQPSTYVANDGIPPGEYVLTATWPKMSIVEGEERAGPDQLNNRFNDSQHPVATITVKEGENQLEPINLKTK